MLRLCDHAPDAPVPAGLLGWTVPEIFGNLPARVPEILRVT